MQKAYLLLEDGTRFEGNLFGAGEKCLGEVVFNTGMTGYQETLTDPSYYGQIVVMTYPLIGNYGFNSDDEQSDGPKVSGFIIREGCESFSNWRGSESLEDYFFRHKLTGLADVDTRALTRHIREKGTLRGMILPGGANESLAMEQILSFNNLGAVSAVTAPAPYLIKPELYHVAVLDFGIKGNILKELSSKNLVLHVFPADAGAEEILAVNPDGIFLSNGPGDPEEQQQVILEIRKLLEVCPIFGICLGHQILALALGGKTEKMKFGHRGSNHPVRDIALERVFITSQNHGYQVVEDSLDKECIEITHVHVNDKTVEGFRHLSLPLFSVQFHPEASPGPSDSSYLFDRFVQVMQKHKELK